MCHAAHTSLVSRVVSKKRKKKKREKTRKKSARHKETPEKKARARVDGRRPRGSVKSFGTARPCLPILLVIDVVTTTASPSPPPPASMHPSIPVHTCASFSSFLYARRTHRECRLLLHTMIYIGEERNGYGRACMQCDYEAQRCCDKLAHVRVLLRTLVCVSRARA